MKYLIITMFIFVNVFSYETNIIKLAEQDYPPWEGIFCLSVRLNNEYEYVGVRIAIINLKFPNGEIGSDFESGHFLAAKKCAEIGGNTTLYVSGVERSDTEEILKLTFKCVLQKVDDWCILNKE